MTLYVGQVVLQASRALGVSAAQFLEAIRIFGTTPDSRSEFSKTMQRDYHPGAGKEIRCTWQFSAAVLDYLDRHHSEIVDEESYRLVYRDCMRLITHQDHRNRRYAYFATDVLPGAERAHWFAGVYALIRQETGEKGRMRQEVLVLDHAGAIERPGRALGTLITPEIVTRGIWAASEKTLTYMGCGRREVYSIGFVSMEFVWPDDRRDLLAGILFGTSSIEGTPVVLPVLAVKLEISASRLALQALCDRPDAELRRLFGQAGRYQDEPAELRAILDGFAIQKETRVMTAAAMISPLRALTNEPGTFILPGIRDFIDQHATEPTEDSAVPRQTG